MLAQVGLALLLAYVVEILIEHFIGKPLEKARPALDRWWLRYVALAAGMLIGWYAAVNIFAEAFENLVLGRILTAILIGGGSQLIHQVVELARKALAAIPTVRGMTGARVWYPRGKPSAAEWIPCDDNDSGPGVRAH